MKLRRHVLTTLAALVCLMSNTSVAHEQMESSGRTMGLSYAPVTALFGAHSLQFEFKMNDIIAPIVHVGVIDNRWGIKPAFNNQPGTFYELRLGARFFITGCPLNHGLFLENTIFTFYGRTPSGTAITTPYAAGPDQWALGSTLEFGYEYVTDFGLSIDAGAQLVGYIGWGFPNSSPGLVDAASYDLNIWRPVVTGRIGYAW